MEMRFRPIVTWPRPLTPSRHRSPFRNDWNNTLRLLDTELRHLQAESLIIQVACQEKDIRLDGTLRGDAKLAHPGVILSFHTKHGPLSYPNDRYVTWQTNARAIALGLEHLRALDRFGITWTDEQYRGWKQLEGPVDADLHLTQPALYIQSLSGCPPVVLTNLEGINTIYRHLVRKHHPDAGGNSDTFNQITIAIEALRQKVGA